MEKKTIVDTFHQYFEFIPATTEALRREAFRIRYEVYCEELAYEDSANFPDGLEQDYFDNTAFHYLIRHKPSGEYAACVRIAVGGNKQILPFETTCEKSLYLCTERPENLAANNCGEISRLAVRSMFRKRTGEQNQPYTIDTVESAANERRTNYPLITYGLYMACFAGSIYHDIDTIFVMMEPRLARRLRILGVVFEQIGLAVDHRGLRAPFRIAPKMAQYQLAEDLQHLIHDMKAVITSAPTIELPQSQVANG